MRVKVKLEIGGSLPINNQSIVNSIIHKCLGQNNRYHDAKSNYSVSSIMGGKLIKGTDKISFKNGVGYIIISSMDMDFMEDITMNIMDDNIYPSNISFSDFGFIKEKFVNGWNNFATLTPFIIKSYEGVGKYKFITLEDDNFQSKVKDYLIKKLSAYDHNLDLSDFEVEINDHPKHKVKKVLVKKVLNKANQCQISIKCNTKVAKVLYHLGVGQSCGSGFGNIYKVENHSIYR